MIAWVVRGLLIVSGAITSWFLAEDALNFQVVQMAVALILIAVIVFAVAFWPESWTRWLDRRGRRE